jgi:hypothetical protein
MASACSVYFERRSNNIFSVAIRGATLTAPILPALIIMALATYYFTGAGIMLEAAW